MSENIRNCEKKPNAVATSLKNGILTENPVFRLVLGTCPTLAVSTSASNAIGMGIAATLVLICSNAVISALRKVIPAKVRIPAYITIIAGFVTIVQMLVKAFAPALDESLGVFLPLIVVNCIILGRAEMFASKNPVALSALDGFSMGIGFTAALLAMSIVRELLGAGALFGHEFSFITESNVVAPMIIFILPPGGFFVFGVLIALMNKLTGRKPATESFGCENCPAAATCMSSTARNGGADND